MESPAGNHLAPSQRFFSRRARVGHGLGLPPSCPSPDLLAAMKPLPTSATGQDCRVERIRSLWSLSSLYRAYRKTEPELDVGIAISTRALLPPAGNHRQACCRKESRVCCQNATCVAKTQRRSLSRAVRRLLVLRLDRDSLISARKPSPDPAGGRGPRDMLRPHHRGDAGILRLLAIWPDDHNRPSMASSAPADRLNAEEIGHLLFVARRHAVDFGDSEVRQRQRRFHGQANSPAQQNPLHRLSALGGNFTKPCGKPPPQFVSVLPNDAPRRFAYPVRRHVTRQRTICGIA